MHCGIEVSAKYYFGGKQLVAASFKECGARDINKVKILVTAENEIANKLYQKSGFDLITQIDSLKYFE